MTTNINSEGIARLARHYLDRRQKSQHQRLSRAEAQRFLESRLGAYDVGGDAILLGMDQHFGGGISR